MNREPSHFLEVDVQCLKHDHARCLQRSSPLIECIVWRTPTHLIFVPDPKKVIAWLRGRHPEEQWPAVSTAGEIPRREGLVRALWSVGSRTKSTDWRGSALGLF